ncbi:MAG TPA: YfhO family protein [Bryobacteraceae bacterium]
MGSIKRRLGMAVLMLAIVAGFYWKLTLTRQFEWVWGPDLAQQVLPWLTVQARALHQGALALWDPYVWGGQPLLGQAQPGAAYPLNWLLFAVPLRHDGFIRNWALTWYFVAIRFMAMAFCYLLCRDLRLSRVASLLAGAVFALGGYIGTTGWPQLVSGALWLPLVFLFLLRAGRGENQMRNAALSGASLGIAWLSGHHQAPMFAMLAAGGAWLYFIFRGGRLNGRVVRLAAMAFAFAFLVGALQILPTYEYGHLAKRWVGAAEPIGWNQAVPYSVHETYDLKPFDLLGVVFPQVFTHSSPFAGITALGLAVLGLACGWRDARARLELRLLAAVGLGALLYALGQHSLFQGFLYAAVPELDKARQASAAIVIFSLALAVCAGFGLDALATSTSPAWSRRVMWFALGFGMFSLALFQTIFFANKFSFTGQDAVMLTPFIAIGFAALILALRRGALSVRQAGVLLLLLVVFELGNNMGSIVISRTDAKLSKWLVQMRANADIADFLKRQEAFPRASVGGEAFAENWGAMHNVEMWGGYLPSLTANLLRFDWNSPQSRLLWGVGYTIAPATVPEGQLVFIGSSGLKVYRHQAAFPRAWAIHELIEAPDAEAGNRIIQERLPDFHRLGFTFDAPPPLETCDGGEQIKLSSHQTDMVQIRASMRCRGMVVLSDVFFPGWRADVDGRAAPIYEVNAAMRGVVVPAGDHTITMRYRPASALAGGTLTLAGILGALAFCLAPARSRDRKEEVARVMESAK